MLNWEYNTDPVVALGFDGTAYYCGLAYGSGFSGQGSSVLWVARSSDGGATWGDAVIVMEWETYIVFHDKQRLIVDPYDPDRLYLTWTPFIPSIDPTEPYNSRIYFGRSDDGGDTWDYYQLSDYDVVQDDVQGTTIAVGPDRVLSVIWIDYEANELVLIQNDQQGAPLAWSSPRSIAEVHPFHSIPNADYRTPTLTSLAADPNSSAEATRLYATWQDDRAGNGDALLVASYDGGATWSEPILLNDDDTANDQFFPWVTVSPRGEVGVLFYDRRNSDNNALLDLYMAFSPDGINWTSNLRISSETFDGSYGYHQSGNVFIGDYIGLVITDTHAYGVWCDTRNLRVDLYAGIIDLEELRGLGF